jgi:DNA-directed RNA polymerase subunit RPC12/RpoP
VSGMDKLLPRQRFWAHLKRVAGKTGVILPSSYYRYSTAVCRKCGYQIIVFDWPAPDKQAKAHTQVLRAPIPEGISRLDLTGVDHAQQKAKEYANKCVNCGGTIQAQQLEGMDGPFYGFKCGIDSASEWLYDMHYLAWVWDTPSVLRSQVTPIEILRQKREYIRDL